MYPSTICQWALSVPPVIVAPSGANVKPPTVASPMPAPPAPASVFCPTTNVGSVTGSTTSPPVNARRRRVTLTPAGVAEWTALEDASQVAAVDLLAPLDESRRARLADALDTAHRLLLAAAIEIELVAPDHPLAAASMGAYFAEIDERFDEKKCRARGLVLTPRWRRRTKMFINSENSAPSRRCQSRLTKMIRLTNRPFRTKWISLLRT